MRTLTCAIWGRCRRNFVLWERVRVWCFGDGVEFGQFLFVRSSLFHFVYPVVTRYQCWKPTNFHRYVNLLQGNSTVFVLQCQTRSVDAEHKTHIQSGLLFVWQNHCTGIFAKQGLLCFGVAHQTVLVGCHPIFLKMPFGFQT